MKGRTAARFSWLIGFHAALFVVLMAEPAGADNCQTFTDCFLTAGAASDAALGMTVLGMLSMGLNFVPYVGTAKGLVEAFVGHDLLTGEELSMTDRFLGLIPGGRLGRLGRLGGRGDEVLDMSRVGPGGRGLTPPPPGRGGPPPPPPPGRGGGGERPPPPPPGRGGGTPDPDDAWRGRPPRAHDGTDTTAPRHAPSSDRQPTGRPEAEPREPRANANEQAWRDYQRNADDIRAQNQNAHVLSQRGFDVHQPGDYTDANGVRRTADYEINGQRFDHKRPGPDTDLDNFVERELHRKAQRYHSRGTQADRFVVDLNNSRFTPEQLRAEITRQNNVPGMDPEIQEVFAIRGNDVIPIYP